MYAHAPPQAGRNGWTPWPRYFLRFDLVRYLAPLAQVGRAFPWYGRGRRFDSDTGLASKSVVVAQLVERHLAKVQAAGSSPVHHSLDRLDRPVAARHRGRNRGSGQMGMRLKLIRTSARLKIARYRVRFPGDARRRVPFESGCRRPTARASVRVAEKL